MPAVRRGVTHKFVMNYVDPEAPRGGLNAPRRTKGFVTLNFFEDGRPGEIFVQMDSVDPALRGMLRCWALAVSMLLQCGEFTPEQVFEKFTFMRFEPSGFLENGTADERRLTQIKTCTSLVDYLARWSLGEISNRRYQISEEKYAI